MNKSDLVSKIAEDANLTKQQASAALNATLENIEAALVAGDKVTLVGFGTFFPEYRKARTGRNPRTKEVIPIAEKVIAKFKPGKDLAKEMDNPALREKFSQ